MALPAPGNPISISQIRTELGSSSGSLRTLSALAGFSTPDSMSEFYGYSAGSTLEYVYNAFGVGYQYATVYYNSTSDSLESSFVSPTITLSPAAQTISVETYDQGGMGVSINYYLNGAYQTTYSSSSYISTGNISTSSGNAYYFDITSGAF